jgi:hypothetical protein
MPRSSWRSERSGQTSARALGDCSANEPVGHVRGQTVPRLHRRDLRCGAAVGFPIARPLQVEDLGPFGEPVQDRVGHGIVGEDL